MFWFAALKIIENNEMQKISSGERNEEKKKRIKLTNTWIDNFFNDVEEMDKKFPRLHNIKERKLRKFTWNYGKGQDLLIRKKILANRDLF